MEIAEALHRTLVEHDMTWEGVSVNSLIFANAGVGRNLGVLPRLGMSVKLSDTSLFTEI